MQQQNKLELDTIALNLREAEAEFRIYCYILKMRSTYRRIKIYKKGYFVYHYIQNALLNDCIMKLSKITDPANQGNNENLTIEYLKDLFTDELSKEEKNTESIHLHNIQSKLKNIRKIRNKELSHQDRNVLDRKKIYKGKRKNVIKLIRSLHNILNLYYEAFKRKYKIKYVTPSYFDPSLNDHIKHIAQVLFIGEKELSNSNEKSIFPEVMVDLMEEMNKTMAKDKFKRHTEIETKLQ